MPDRGTRFYAISASETMDRLGVDAESGLSGSEATSRREKHGPNALRRARRRSIASILLDQLKSVVLIVMGVAGALAFAFGQWAEGIAISAVFLVNGLIGFVSEWRATRSMEALRQIGRGEARVRRDGEEQSIPVEELVPGDVVVVEEGDVAPADLRLFEANNLRVDESALTGESVAVDKTGEPAGEEAPLAERPGMLYRGTTVVQGSGEGVVAATGMETELGRIAELAESAGPQATPLERRLDRLGRRLAWIVGAIAIVVAGLGLLSGRPTVLMIETAIALGVAAIPEGLPVVATIALARGMWVMAKRQALINRLPAVETLGATGVVFTDKTGTLTENRMSARRVRTREDEHDLREDGAGTVDGSASAPDLPGPARRVLEIGVLCNNASLPDEDDGETEAQGDPTEIALLEAGRLAGLDREELLEAQPEVREVAFDPAVMMMATFHRTDGRLRVAVKGAPHALLDAATGVGGDPLDEEARCDWERKVDAMATEGLRVLAFAEREVDDEDAEPYRDLAFLGLVGFLDPPREDAAPAVEACRRAGVRVVMVTGDQPRTAEAIARMVEILRDEDGEDAVVEGAELGEPDELDEAARERIRAARVFARVSPGAKLGIVRVFQDAGEIVAMTGDGVNDAPALEQADIGVAMGRRGTDAAREAADMVLKDDSLASIVAAIRQGRVIFANIRKSVVFMLCTNVAEVIAVAAASVMQAPLPLLPLQILYLNVLTDVFPALALGVGEGEARVMERPPRDPEEPILTRAHWTEIGGWAVLIAACVLGALAFALLRLELDERTAVTVSFLTLGFGKLWFVFVLRDRGSSAWRNDVTRNPWVWGALGLCTALLLAAAWAPGLTAILRTTAPTAAGWATILGFSLPPFLLGQLLRSRQSQD